MEQIRDQFSEFVAHIDSQKEKIRAGQPFRFGGLLFSKGDDDKEPPKGFEKFFRKRNERKEATETKEEKESTEKKGKSHTRRVVFRLICITLQKRVMKRRQTKRRKRRLSRSQLKEKERKKDSKTKRKVILNRFCATSTTILVETTLKGGWAS